MAKLVVVAALSMLTGMLAGAACGLRAEEVEALEAVAAEAGVEPVHLEGAVNTTGLEPRAYLQAIGVIERPLPPQSARSVWDVLASCESTGNWAAISSGGTYRGGLQFDQPTWRAYGGQAYASSAHLATRAQQIAVAERLRAARGFQPWPVCSVRMGLR